MELVLSLMALLGAFIGALAAHFVAHDAYECCPRYARKIIEFGVRKLPIHQRARYREEWLADLAGREGVILKFKHAIECWLCSAKMAAACSERCAEPVAFKISDCEVTLMLPGSLFVVLHTLRQWPAGDHAQIIEEGFNRFPVPLQPREHDVCNVVASITRYIGSRPTTPPSRRGSLAQRRQRVCAIKCCINGEWATVGEILTDFDWL